jgi:hypothetical protein
VETAASSLPRPRPCASTPPELPRPHKCALRVPRGRGFFARAVTVASEFDRWPVSERAPFDRGFLEAKLDFDRGRRTLSATREHVFFQPPRKTRKPAFARNADPFASRTPYVAHASYNNSGVSHA